MFDMGPIAREEYELVQTDSKYRLYVGAIDRALKIFESTTEWADLIAALGKLNKVIGQHTKYQIIPRRLKISKRLAQCMHPNLPFGVHLKALETYDLIFKSMGTNRLSHELFIYSAGLFPLFGNCAMKVRPDLLTIYETHFVPLGIRLRPALPGFLSGVLPGFEESSDHLARTNQLLETVCEGVGPTHFYGCVWDCIASNSIVRLPALAFALSHFDKKKTTEDQPHIMGTDIETMVCGLIACVQDANIFVQRSALDLLILGFPLYNSHLTTDDMIRLVTAAISTIPRRDQSLNRRIFAWLLGMEVNMTMLAHYPQIIKAKAQNKVLTYFEVFSRSMLVKALTVILDNAIGERPFALQPYQLLVSLLDKDGLGPAILDDILLEYFRLLYLSCNFDQKADVSELLSEANFLFSSIEPKFLWAYIGQLFTKACSKSYSTCLDFENPVRRVASGDAGVVEICTLTEFLLDKVSAFDASPDTHRQHLPTLFLQMVTILSDNCDKLTVMQIIQALNLCSKILNRVQPLIVGHHNDNDDSSDTDSSIINSSSNYQFESVSSEPIQNSVCSSIDDKYELPGDDSELTIEKTDSLLELCMRQYERFYVNFIYSLRERMGERRKVSTLVEALNRGSNNNEEMAKRYENLLDDILQQTASTYLPEQKCSSNLLGKEWVDPVRKASRLLVDLSTLKTFLKAPTPRGLLESEGHIEDTVIESLPEWLCVLMTCSCWFNKSSHLQIASIAAILDLVTLCTTAQSLVSNSTNDGATAVLIRPLLTPCHLSYMEKNTFIFEAMCHWLWQQLDVTDHKVQSVELLHQLHSAFPVRDIVETCISVYLEPHHEKLHYQTTRLDSFRKFSALWNIGREINSRLGNALRVSDIFYKSMLKMLDNFKLPGCDSLKTEAQEWLLHSLIRGDTHRILDPILFMLLDPTTARISVLHIRINSNMASDGSSLQSAVPDDQIVTLNSSNDSKAPNPVKNKGHKGPSKGKGGGSILSAIAAAIASPPVQHKQKFSTETKVCETTNDSSSSVSLSINSFAGESSTVNTDFDEFFEEVAAEKSAESLSKAQLTSQLVVRNRSFPSLDKEAASYGYFGINEALKNTSIDLLSLSDSIMTKISDGELPFNRFRPGSLSSDRISNMLPTQDCGDLIKSWAYPSKEAEGSDLEESTAADEYFSSDKDSMSIVDEVINDLLDKVSERTANSEIKKEPEFKRGHRKLQYQQSFTSHPSNIDSLHAHMLLYKNRYDVETVLYCLETLKNILLQHPRAFLIASSSTRLVSRSPILKLLARHKKSLFGRGFSGDLEESNIRSSMYLEVMMMMCLYYIRSYYPEPSPSAQRDIDNKRAQISSVEVLTLLCTELIRIVREGSRSLASYLSDVFSRLKVYKIILHSLLTNINNRKTSSQPLTHDILKFNNGMDVSTERLSHTSETLIKQQIKLLLSLIILEHEIMKLKGDLPSSNLVDRQLDMSETKYINGRLIPQQPLFIQAVQKLLDNHPAMRYIHSQWTSLITCSLPFMGSALSKIVTTALKQICISIETSSECYSSSCSLSFPPDYGIVLLESLTIMCHYCLLDTSSSLSPPSSMGSDDIAYSQVFKNLTHLFMPVLADHKERNEGKLLAKKAVLGHLPRVIASISTLWHALVNRKDRESANCEVGSPLVMKQKIIEFLSPLAVQHPSSFLAAMAVVWRERSQPLPASTLNMVLPEACENQKVLIQLLIGIKAMPIHVLVQTLNQVVKQPTLNQESAITVEISALELFVNYVQHVLAPSLLESWPSLLQLLKDAPTLSPPALFLMMGTLSHLVHRCEFNDKKDIKDLQDVTVKLIEASTTIVGACLEQTTWIRKNLAVREEDPNPALDKEDRENDLVVSETPTSEGKTKKGSKSERKKVARKIRHDADKLQIRTMHQWFLRAFVNDGSLPLDYTDRHKSGSNSLAQYSINALNVLAHLLAPLLEITFGSPEKERVVTILNNLMVNVVPYLKNHTQRNAASYYACSQLLASITSYQYTRKAWKKDVIELMFDPGFFQMELRSLQSWKTITDNLISQEISTFRDFMSRVNVPQGSSFGIFNSREAEYEQRAQLLKRLAFVIYCSEIDKFANNMPEFLERLTESTKIPHNGVLAQVFLCFRVMLLRMSKNIIIPLWPVIISEVLQVMTLMERELSSELENYNSNVRSLLATDWNWVTNNGSNSQALWLQLQLAAASLLFLAVQLPADRLPQFQLYRWAFVGGDSGSNSRAPVPVTPDFVPHVVKIAVLMDAKFGTLEALPTPLLPTPAQLTTAEELHPFFCAMRSGRYTPLTVTQLEHQLELDILDSTSIR